MISIDSHTYEKKRARILSDIHFYSDTLALNEGTPNEVAIRAHLKAAQNALQRLDSMASEVRREETQRVDGGVKELANQILGGVNALAKGQKSQNKQLANIEKNTAGLPEGIETAKEEAARARVAAEDAKAEAAKAVNRPTAVINAQPGSTVNVVKPPRTDKGGNHGRTARGWRTQAEVAADFSKASKTIRGKTYGDMTIEKVKDWEKRYPDASKREKKSGYHARLRQDPNLKTEYWDAVARWSEYWREWCTQYREQLKIDSGCTPAQFTRYYFTHPGKTVHRSDTDKTERYGADTSFTDSLDDGRMDGDED